MPQTSVPTIGNSPFAHLARAAGVAPKAEDDETKKALGARAAEDGGDDDDEEKKAKGKKAKAEEGDEDEDKKAKGKKAAAEDDDDDDEDGKKAKGKKAKAEDDEEEEGDDNSDREDDDEPKARAARSRERGRIKAIVLSDAGKANPVAAMHLACGTSMSRRQAVNMLAAMGPATPAASGNGLRERMANAPQPDIGEDTPAPASGAQATAQAIIAAGKKARGEK